MSLKPSEPGTPGYMRGGPGSTSPGQIDYRGIPAMTIIRMAYHIPPYRIFGPAWLTSDRFDLVAKLPAGTTSEQLSAMLRKLLADRFSFAAHHEDREIPVYQLTVGKSGPRFKPSDPEAPAQPAGRPHPGKLDEWGFGAYDGPAPLIMTRGDGSTEMNLRKRTIAEFSQMLSMLDRPVIDATGLQGPYDLTIAFSAGAPPVAESASTPPGLPGIFEAVQSQLGLKLEPKKASLDTLVIDRMERKPAEN